MTADGKNRVSHGVPAGGQFAASEHSESPVRLFDRTDGSFLKPAPSATATHCIQFWSNVEIPDEIIAQVESEYRVVRDRDTKQELDQRMVEWTKEWQAENPEPRGDRKLQEYSERYREAYAEYYKSIEPFVQAKRPERLGDYDSRQLVRAAQMLWHRPASKKFPGEGDKVLSEPIELFDEVLTVLEIERKYGLYRIHYAMEKVFPKSDDAVVEALEGARAQLSGIREELASQRSEY